MNTIDEQTEKSKMLWTLKTGLRVGEELLRALEPVCERIAIVGSVRRRKADIGDVELLYIPKFTRRIAPGDFFKEIDIDLATEKILELEMAGVLKRRKNINGQTTFGPSNKFMIHRKTGLPVDCFATNCENWWTALVVRTGSRETNLRLTNSANRMQRSLMVAGCGVRTWDGQIMPANSEEEVFQLCGVPFLKPEDR